jgi:hypothetical protein
MVNNIIYKKVEDKGTARLLSQQITGPIKFVPDYVLTKDVQSTESRMEIPFFLSA